MGYRGLRAGRAVIRERERAATRCYVIVAGKAEVTRQVDGEQKTLGFLGGGSIFGELSLLTGHAATATVTAVTDMEVFEIRREHLNAVAKSHPRSRRCWPSSRSSAWRGT